MLSPADSIGSPSGFLLRIFCTVSQYVSDCSGAVAGADSLRGRGGITTRFQNIQTLPPTSNINTNAIVAIAALLLYMGRGLLNTGTLDGVAALPKSSP